MTDEVSIAESGPVRREPPDGREPAGRVLPVLFACFFFSGASGLVYEVVWLRWLVHLFGATTLAVSTILTAFMGGLALGSWLAGRWAPRVRRPLRAYGWLELGIGAYAFLLPLCLGAVPSLLSQLGATEASSFLTLSLVRFGLAAALLIAPTACMGATLPILAHFAAPRLDRLGSRVGRLYAVNTTGAVLGTGVAGFLLLPAVGVTLTNQIAVALNLAVGLTALLADRWWTGSLAAGPGGPPAERETESSGARRAPTGEARRLAAAALATAAASGALAMVYEVAWARTLALVLGSSVYGFTVMLTTVLLGLAGGSYLGARRVDRLRDPGLALGLIQLGIGVAAFAGLLLLGELPYLFLRLFAWSAGHHALLLSLEFLVTGALILVPAFLSGAVFPVCVRLAGEAGTTAGRTVGNLYALNTLGAIVGSFAGGFVLLPTTGIRGTLLLAILLNLACALALLALATRRAARLPFAIGIPVLALAVPLLAPEWQALTMSSGVAVYAPSLHRMSRQEFQAYRERASLLWYEEGLTTTVSVEELDGKIGLRVNGKTDASTGLDMLTQVLSGHLPLLFHPEPRDVLVIGLGSGVTVGSALRHPLRSVTVVELERGVVSASHFFDHVNSRPLDDPRTRLVVNDGRNFLLLTRDRFDVIISEPSNPWITGAASLFTRDFFALARARLRPGGVFGQWMQLYGLTPEMLQSLMASFTAVFPYTAAFRTVSSGGDLVLVGSDSPPRLGFGAIERRLAAPAVAVDLRRVGVRDAADLFVRLVLDVEDVPRFTRGAVVNTDDNALVEFTAPRTLYVNVIAENVQQLTDSFGGGGRVLTELTRDAPDGFVARLVTRFLERDQPHQAEAAATAALRGRPRADLLALAARAAAAQGEGSEAERRWQAALALAPSDPEILFDLATHLEARGQAAEARVLLSRAGAPSRPETTLREAALLYRLGAYRDAEARLRQLPPEMPGVALTAGRTRLALGDAAGAEHLLRQALAGREDAGGRAGLAAALEQLGRPTEARRERRRADELEEAEGAQLRQQARLRARAGHLRWAEYELRRAHELMPGSRDVHEEWARLLEQMGDRRAAVEAWEGVFRTFPGQARALIEVAALWEAEGDRERAREALRRYVSAEPDGALRRRAEALIGPPRSPAAPSGTPRSP